MIEAARMLKRRFENIIAYLRHRITNAASESINAKIQWGEVHGAGLPEQAELRACDLLPLWRPRSGPRIH
jgi:hypothetical protein